MDLKTKCYILARREQATDDFCNGKYDAHYPVDRTLKTICEDVENWINEPALKTYFEPIIEERGNWDFYEECQKPISERNWTVSYDNRGAYPKRDITYLRHQIGADYYVYVHNEVEGAYGVMKEVAIDGTSNLTLLPTIKQFTEELEVGKFYIVTFEKEINFGRGKKYCYDIKEITEEEYCRDAIFARMRHFSW